MLRGAEAGLKTIGMELAEKTSYKRGATDFSSQVARMKAAGCDFVVLGTIIRETIGTIGEARKTGFNPTFLGSSAAYTDLIHKLGGKAMDGLYATHDGAEPLPRRGRRSRSASGPTSTRPSSTRIRPCSRSTATTSIDAFARAADQGRPEPVDRQLHQGDGHDELRARHVRQRAGELHGRPSAWAATLSRLSQLQDGRWKVVSDYIKPN